CEHPARRSRRDRDSACHGARAMTAPQKHATTAPRRLIPTATHWGNFLVEVDGEAIVGVHGYTDDPHPSPIGRSLADSRDPRVRIDQPMVRRGYLERGRAADGRGRGRDPFVAVSWDEALDLAAATLDGIRSEHGNAAIYGGSY